MAMLKQIGCRSSRIDRAQNGQQAFEMFQHAFTSGKPYDAVLMDLSMPVMNGLEALKTIRAYEVSSLLGSSKRTPVLAVTAHAGPQQVEECIANGFQTVITKPVKMPLLRSALLQHVGSS